MSGTRLYDRLLAILALIAGGVCVWAFLDAAGRALPMSPWRGGMLGGAAVLSLAAGFALWKGWTPGVASGPDGRPPAFGRGGVRLSSRPSALRLFFAIIPIVVIALVLADRWIERDAPLPEHPSEAQPPVATEPAPPVVAKPEVTAEAPPPSASPPTVTAPPLPEQPIVPLPPALPPPQTVAPLPQPVQPPILAEGHRDAVVWISVSPDGRTMLSASVDRSIKLWDTENKRLIRDLGVHEDMARTALFLPDGKRALTAGDDGKIVLRSLADGAALHVFSAIEHGSANKLALSKDGRRAVSVHGKGSVIVWDIEGRKLERVLTGHDWSASGLAVSPDGTRAATGSIDGTLKLWDLDTGRLLRTGHPHELGIYGAAFSLDNGLMATGSGDTTIKLWDAESGAELQRYNGHSKTVYALAISEDGRRLLSGSLDGTARLWDLATGREIAMFAGHEGPVYAVAFGPHGTIVTGGNDRTIRFWPEQGGEATAIIAGGPD